MAIVRAVKSGNWSDTTVWNTGALPTSADDVYSNTFTVTIDISPTVLSISNAATTGVTAGGSFVISANGITLTANVSSGVNVLSVNVGAGLVASIIGNVIMGTTSSTSQTVSMSGAGTLSITGAVTAASNNGSNNCRAVNLSGSGVLNIAGACTGGSTGGASNPAVIVTGSGTANITGTCTAGTNGDGVTVNSGTANITGNCVGGASATSAGASNQGGTLNHVGTVTASSSGPGIGPGVVGQITTLTGPLISSDGSGGTAAASGVNPCTALRWFPADTALSTFEYRMRGQTVSGSPSVRPARQLFLTDAYSAGYPTASNVRSGTTYGPGSIYTGTCAVPGASSVVVGVPVDNTVGTAAVTAATIRAAVGLASANLDTQLAAIPTTAAPTAAAIRSEMDANSTKLANLDATVSSRLAAASYSAPPSAAANASAVRTELAPELGNLDATVSSRLPSSGYTAPPSAASIATAVWSAASRTLTTAIDNSSAIAAAVWAAATRTLTSNAAPSAADNAAAVWGYSSGRTVTGGTVDTVTNSTPVDAGEIADAVRTELTPELARLSNAATTQEVGDIVEGALAD